MSSPKPGSAPIAHSQDTVVVCHSETAITVFVAGSFNDQSPTAKPMKKANDGRWSASLPLVPGPYEYKFVVGGECCEPGCISGRFVSHHAWSPSWC